MTPAVRYAEWIHTVGCKPLKHSPTPGVANIVTKLQPTVSHVLGDQRSEEVATSLEQLVDTSLVASFSVDA